MHSSTDWYNPNNRNLVGEGGSPPVEQIGVSDTSGTTVTPCLLEAWREEMVFWKNHDTCRRMFNWVREVLGSLDESFLRKIFNKLLHDGELVNDHVRIYLHMNGYSVAGRDIIDIPYWMHAAFLQVIHLIYLDDDIMLSESIEELTWPRIQHKNAKNITIMLNMFFEFVTERPFLMREFPMNNWGNNVEYVDGAEISTDCFDKSAKVLSQMGVGESCEEKKDHPNEGAANPINEVDSAPSIDHTDRSENEDNHTKDICNDTEQSNSVRIFSSTTLPSSVDASVDHHQNNEGSTNLTDEKGDELARLTDITNCSAENSIAKTDNQSIPLPSLMDSHPAWNSIVFKSSLHKSAKLKVTVEEKAQFNTNVFNDFFGVTQGRNSLNSSKKESPKVRNGIFFGLTVYFTDDAASHAGQSIKAIVANNGGKVYSKLRRTATHMVTKLPVPWYKIENLRRNTNCRVVNPEWVLECVRVGRRVCESAFNMVGPQPEQQTIQSFINRGINAQISFDDDLANTRRKGREFDEIFDEFEGKNKRYRINSYVAPDDYDTSNIQGPVFVQEWHKEVNVDVDEMSILSESTRISDL
ncbi:5807_t:CDS:2 [Funneliformis geosporum]|uniref:11704_t:CDS:1 n=1 Tax=Funneliformis geosporum TaxID=1117311 RepID=A0A9W4WUJ5_9GLOM|nr:5807_t:CDS:2 [Funneliformis geosporum]CAI2164646.1 11704_t:CDS:2 [Funneliformis geosporum]